MIYLEYIHGNTTRRYKFKHIDRCLAFLKMCPIIKQVIISDLRITPKVKYKLLD